MGQGRLRPVDRTRAPATLDALLAHGQELIDAGRVRRTLAVQANPFPLSPVFTAAGAPPLLTGASDDPTAPAEHLDLAALIRALATLRDLGPHGRGVLDPDADDVTTRGQFLDRAAPYLIGLSEDLSDIRRSGLRYAISAVPGFAGGPQPGLSCQYAGSASPRTGRTAPSPATSWPTTSYAKT